MVQGLRRRFDVNPNDPVVGDYAAGATHILPTGGLARGSGGLGLEAFLKPVQIVRGVPSELNRALAMGEIDIAPASSIERPRQRKA